MMGQTISIELVYALPDQAYIKAMDVEADATIRSVIELSGILEQGFAIDLNINRVGVYGQLRDLTGHR